MVPVSGYANRVITLKFPEISEEGDLIQVVIRNPKLIPPGELRRKLKTGPNGEVDDDDAYLATMGVFAKLIIGWHVYDGTVTTDDQPLLPSPATAEAVAKLPGVILTRLGEELGKVNPQTPTASPEEPTSKTS